MEKETKLDAKSAYTLYLKQRGGRCTSERFAILEAVASFPGHFTVEELEESMRERKFHVSRSTLYYTLADMIGGGFVMRHQFGMQPQYEYVYGKPLHHHQVCIRCGRVAEFQHPELDMLVQGSKFRRFTLSSYTFCAYGLCTSCVAQLRKLEKKKNKELNNTKKK